MSDLITLKYHDTDDGFCRVYYTFTNAEGRQIIYCWQEEADNCFVFYKCTDWPEPEYAITPKATIRFERPEGDTTGIGERLTAKLTAAGILVEREA